MEGSWIKPEGWVTDEEIFFPSPVLKRGSFIPDERGGFLPIALGPEWSQINVSISKKFVFRGLHHQQGKAAQSKMVTVLKGSIVDMLIDLRATKFGEFHKFEMKAGDSLFVPRGFAHSFLALDDDTIVQYLVDKPYCKEAEISIHWQSHISVKTTIDWICPNPIISEKDNRAAYLDSSIHTERISKSFADVPKINT